MFGKLVICVQICLNKSVYTGYLSLHLSELKRFLNINYQLFESKMLQILYRSALDFKCIVQSSNKKFDDLDAIPGHHKEL